MEVIEVADLAARADDLIRRAEGGERFTISAQGRPIAELGPVGSRSWVDTADVQELWDLAVDPTYSSDIRDLSSVPLLEADLDR